jgi:hypothetical protein
MSTQIIAVTMTEKFTGPRPEILHNGLRKLQSEVRTLIMTSVTVDAFYRARGMHAALTRSFGGCDIVSDAAALTQIIRDYAKTAMLSC